MNRAKIARLTAGAAAFIAMSGIPMATSATAVASVATDAFLRGAHFSPDTAGVDVYLTAFRGGTSTLWLSDVGYGDVSPYRQIAAGTYAVSMRPHGASPSIKPVLSWTVNLRPGDAYTAAAVGMSSQIRGVVVSDALDPPPSGNGLVRVIQASSRAGHVSVSAHGGPVLTSDTAFGATTKYVDVPSGRWTVHAKSSTRPSLSASAPVTIKSASITSVILLDAKDGGLAVRAVLDAAGVNGVPSGSVPAGGGGTAANNRPSSLDGIVSWAALGCAVLALSYGVRSRRRDISSRP